MPDGYSRSWGCRSASWSSSWSADSPRTASPCWRSRPRLHRRRRHEPRPARDLVRVAADQQRADIRLPAARDPGGGRQRRPAVRGGRVHPVRSVAPAPGSARGRFRPHARGRDARAADQRHRAMAPPRRAGAEPHDARRLPRGGRRRGGLGGGRGRGRRHRADRTDRRRCAGVGDLSRS